MNNPSVLDYVAGKIMADIRSDAAIPSEVIDEAVKYELTNHLRTKVKADDFGLVKRICESPYNNLQRLGLSLIQGLRQREDVNYKHDIYQYLLSLWDSNLEFDARASLIYALLDYVELPAEFHEKLLRFTEEKWDEMISHTLDWCGGPGAILSMNKERLQNPKYPRSKRWIYLCHSTGADDLQAARMLVQSYENDEDPFLRQVVQKVLSRIDAVLTNTNNHMRASDRLI